MATRDTEADNKDLEEVPTREGSSVLARSEIEEVFRRGSQFASELLKENERLRFKLAELSSSSTRGDDDALIRELIDKIARLEQERDALRDRFGQVEAENRDFAERYVEIEAENNNLLNIYVASHQLHSTLDFDEVVQIITEIVLNFIGAEVFAVALVDSRHGSLHPVITEGVEEERVRQALTQPGVVADVLKSGVPYLASNFREVSSGEPLACIPMMIRREALGVMIIYKFLQQKTELVRVDHELFSLLAGHAATALFAAKLYGDSQRKLNTIQGLIDLVAS